MLRGPSLGIRKRLCDLNAEPRKRLRQGVVDSVGAGAGGTEAVLLILLVPVQELWCRW